jgi:hypothetical protein
MSSTVTVNWEWILGTSVTLIIIFLAWIARQVSELKKESELRLRALENSDSAKKTEIDLLNKLVLNQFEKGEKEDVSKRKG